MHLHRNGDKKLAINKVNHEAAVNKASHRTLSEALQSRLSSGLSGLRKICEELDMAQMRDAESKYLERLKGYELAVGIVDRFLKENIL